MKKEVISLFIDGEQVKAVHAKKEKGRVKLLSLESIPLKSRIERKEVVKDDDDPFGLDFDENETGETGEKENGNNNIIYEILNGFSLENISVSVNLPESNVGFMSVDNVPEKSKRKIKKLVIKEIEKKYSVTTNAFAVLPSNNGSKMAVFQRGNNPVYTFDSRCSMQC